MAGGGYPQLNACVWVCRFDQKKVFDWWKARKERELRSLFLPCSRCDFTRRWRSIFCAHVNIVGKNHRYSITVIAHSTIIQLFISRRHLSPFSADGETQFNDHAKHTNKFCYKASKKCMCPLINLREGLIR